MKKKILICDDDEGILEVLTIILQNGGYDVRALNNSKEVKKAINDYHPDVLLLDVMMPEANGRDITMDLKKNKSIKVPIILLSAVNNFAQMARETGANDFMVKPFDMKALLAKVAKHAGS